MNAAEHAGVGPFVGVHALACFDRGFATGTLKRELQLDPNLLLLVLVIFFLLIIVLLLLLAC